MGFIASSWRLRAATATAPGRGPIPVPAIPSSARSCLVIGGARSGKSAFAQRLAEDADRAPLYLATATAWDAEMEARVAAHRAARDGRWRTREEPLALAEALAEAARPDTVVLVDCLTLWLSNLMLGDHDVAAATGRLVRLIPALSGPVIFVSNEVGAGLVPETPLGRRFRDAQGRLNQEVAAACDAVVLVAAGLPLRLKPAPDPAIVLT